MDFQLTRIQQMTQREMRDFVRKEVVPLAREWDENSNIPLTHYQQALALGIMDMALPEALGGAGEDFLCFIMVLEAFAYGSAALAHSIGVTEALVHLLYRYGNKRLQQAYLSPLQEGAALGALSITATGAGDNTATPLLARQEGSNYRLNGTLPYVPHAPMANMAILFAETDGGAKTAFVVDRKTEGVTVSEPETLMGVRGFPMGRLTLKEVLLSRDRQLVGEDMGGTVFNALQSRIHTTVGAIAVGTAQAALEEATRHSKARVQFAQPLARMQATQNKIANMAAGLAGARLLVYQSADDLDRGEPTIKAAMAKVTAADLAIETAKEAVQIHGGYGYVRDYMVERLYRDAVFAGIYPTLNETQRTLIAEAVCRTIT